MDCSIFKGSFESFFKNRRFYETSELAFSLLKLFLYNSKERNNKRLIPNVIIDNHIIIPMQHSSGHTIFFLSFWFSYLSPTHGALFMIADYGFRNLSNKQELFCVLHIEILNSIFKLINYWNESKQFV